jgi:hypothetical protein
MVAAAMASESPASIAAVTNFRPASIRSCFFPRETGPETSIPCNTPAGRPAHGTIPYNPAGVPICVARARARRRRGPA